MIDRERVHIHKPGEPGRGDYILYWMQSAQRVKYNHALDYALQQSRESKQPLVVYFGLTPEFPSANLRHYAFMIEGIEEVARTLSDQGIYFALKINSPPRGAMELAVKASLLVMDDGYLNIQKQWRKEVIERVSCPVVEVATNVIVPVQEASEKEQYSAATLRPRIHKKLQLFTSYTYRDIQYDNKLYIPAQSTGEVSIEEIGSLIKKLPLDNSVPPSPVFKGGFTQAEKLLRDFITNKIASYDEERNHPERNGTSNLSPYLHFGQISPLQIYQEVMRNASRYSKGFLEELMVRRELSFNFVHYNAVYDTFQCLPEWCKKTLKEHAGDRREYQYSLEQLEKGQTHDDYWNAAQLEMVYTGKMSGYMRMYWGKKVIEWTGKPEEAYKNLVYLNDRYELDGRDPNGYAGIAWCFGKHDRPWQERSIFGKIRYMNDRGLKRKFPDIQQYVDRVFSLAKKT